MLRGITHLTSITSIISISNCSIRHQALTMKLWKKKCKVHLRKKGKVKNEHGQLLEIHDPSLKQQIDYEVLASFCQHQKQEQARLNIQQKRIVRNSYCFYLAINLLSLSNVLLSLTGRMRLNRKKSASFSSFVLLSFRCIKTSQSAQCWTSW